MRFTLAAVLGLLVLTLPAQAVRHSVLSTVTIRLYSTEVSTRVIVDRPPKGSDGSKGDVVSVKSTLRNAVAQFGQPKGAVVGSLTSVFTLLAAQVVNVKVHARLPGGSLRAVGRIYPDKLVVIRVVGGTGEFASARGTAEARGANGGRTLNVYRLQLP